MRSSIGRALSKAIDSLSQTGASAHVSCVQALYVAQARTRCVCVWVGVYVWGVERGREWGW